MRIIHLESSRLEANFFHKRPPPTQLSADCEEIILPEFKTNSLTCEMASSWRGKALVRKSPLASIFIALETKLHRCLPMFILILIFIAQIWWSSIHSCSPKYRESVGEVNLRFGGCFVWEKLNGVHVWGGWCRLWWDAREGDISVRELLSQALEWVWYP